MSAPKTNLPKQKRRHWGPIIGISAVLVFVLLIVFLFTGQDDSEMTGNGAPAGWDTETAPDADEPQTAPESGADAPADPAPTEPAPAPDAPAEPAPAPDAPAEPAPAD